MINFDVTYINAIENVFLHNLTVGFAILTTYARHLLYYFIVFEIIFAGFSWALYQSQLAERLFFQLLKVGLILFIVSNYAYLLDGFLKSFLMIGDQINQQDLQNFLLNPGYLWQYGYDFALDILKIAASADGFALPIIMIALGFGILLVIGIFGIQIFLQVVAFYLVAVVSLLMIPLSVFSPLRDFFSQSIKGLLQAGIRLFVQMLIVSVAVMTWSNLMGEHFTSDMNINAPLGIFFSGLLFVFASAYLPKVVAKLVGNIHWQDTPMVINTTLTSVGAVSAPAGGSGMVSGAVSAAVLVQPVTSATQQAAMQAALANAPQASSASMISQALRSELAKTHIPTSALKGLSTQYRQELEKQRKENIKLLKTAFQEVLQARAGKPQ